MDKNQEIEALSIVCDELANSCDSDEVSAEKLGGVLCCLKRVTNVLDLDWNDIQTCSYKLNESINEAKEKDLDGK